MQIPRVLELLIFNRWGNLIKTTTGLYDTWDGTFNGQRCQDIVYTWSLRAYDGDEIARQRVGPINLLR
jgi:gliding motility-associated-like protein